MKKALAMITRISHIYEINADENNKDYVEFIAKTPFEPKIKAGSSESLLYYTQRLYSQRKGE